MEIFTRFLSAKAQASAIAITVMNRFVRSVAIVFSCSIGSGSVPAAAVTQADTTTINFVSDVAGEKPFIHKLNFNISPPGNLRSVQFTIQPKAGSVTRPISASYPSAYLNRRGFFTGSALQVPVFGLYADFSNSVTLTWVFNDDSTKQSTLQVATAAYFDNCQADKPIVEQPRTNSTSLSYDYILLKRGCSPDSPAILDTDGELRWVGTASGGESSSAFFDNSVYIGGGPIAQTAALLRRIEMDGAVNVLADYRSIGVNSFHHNIDAGKNGLILEVNTATDIESTLLEVDKDGRLLKRWNMADIISATMLAGGDDPNGFVLRDQDWFHNNAATYRASDDTLIVSSRENFVIALDYETGAIKWILGDPTKAWYQYASLRAFALTVTSGVPPIGQHAVSITYNDKLLLFDNGAKSIVQMPPGIGRSDDGGIPRKYSLDLANRTAAEVWKYDTSIVSVSCSSVYEDAPNNYLVDYAVADNGRRTFAEIQGLEEDGSKVFDYKYPTEVCATIFNAYPLHLEHVIYGESTAEFGGVFRNFSARVIAGSGASAPISGFIVSGDAKTVVLRGLGPTLGQSPLNVAGVLADPTLQLFDSGGHPFWFNDNWKDTQQAQVQSTGLAPPNNLESAILQILQPGSYTAALSGKNGTTGVGLVEVYDVSQGVNAEITNLSTRGFVGTNQSVLIGGFMTSGGNGSTTVVVRGLGPTLAQPPFGVSGALADPVVTLVDGNGNVVQTNDNWKNTQQAAISATGKAPPNDLEAAILVTVPAGNYTAILSGNGGGTGIGLLEVYKLPAG